MNRDKVLGVSITTKEYQAIRRAAFRAGYNSMSSFVYDELLKPALEAGFAMGTLTDNGNESEDTLAKEFDVTNEQQEEKGL